MNRNLNLCVCFAAFCMAGCSGETQLPEATGKGNVLAINAISTSPPIAFMIEERSIASVSFKSASNIAQYDDLDYTFNFETLFAGESEATRIASQHLDVINDTTYAFVINGALAAPTITVWESPEAVFGEGATNFEIQFGHAADSIGEVDVYFDDPTIDPAPGNAIGTIALGDVLPVASHEAGEYVLTLTSAGDHMDVLFETNTMNLGAGSALLFSVFDPDANTRSPVALSAFNLATGVASPVVDTNASPTLRFFHGSFDVGAVDIYSDDPLTTPLVEDHLFGDITGDVAVPNGTVPITYTTADNMGSVLIDLDRTIIKGTHANIYLIEESDGSTVVIDHFPDRRTVETLVKLSIVNTAAIGTNLDIYVVPTGTAIDDLNPLLLSIPVGIDPIDFTVVEGSFDIYVTPTGDKTDASGPFSLDVAVGDVVDLVIYETVAPPTVDLVIVPPP